MPLRVLAGAAALGLAATACTPAPAGDPQPVPHHEFTSRPDLRPVQVTQARGPAWTDAAGTAEEFVFLTLVHGTETPGDGAVILDARGEPVWMKPTDKDVPDDNVFDLRVQRYRGEPVLTYYEGTSDGGRGVGEVVVLDRSYEEVARVTTGGSLGPGRADFHDTTITAEGTMLLAAYVPVPTDLSAVGGPEDGHALDAVVQEVDVATGEVLFEWSALDHVPVTETMVDFEAERREAAEEAEEAEEDEDGEDGPLGTAGNPFDYFHVNSVTEDADGALLVSARHTHAVYRVDRGTGEVDWTLGGSAGDFALGEGAAFSWQHDAQRSPDGTLTLFDNATHAEDEQDGSSRGLRLALDEEAMTASVVTEYTAPDPRPAWAMANAQELADGGMFLGWGAQSYYSEYTADGQLVYDACHGDSCRGEDFHGGGGSYRAYKLDWEGRPATDPDVVVRDGTAHVSWNGATEVTGWRVVAGDDEASATPGPAVDRDGFETTLPVPEDAGYLAVEALDAEGNVLGTARH